MYSFSDKFQSSVKFHSVATYSLATLLVALDNASNHQFPINETKSGAITKSFVKGDLLVQPKLAFITGEEDTLHIVSGRHRVTAVKNFTETYGITSAGKTVLITEANRDNVDRIAGDIECLLFEVPNLATLGQLMMAENGSRSMNAAEKAVVKLRGNVATPGEMLKVRVSNVFIQCIPSLTAPTAMGIAAKLVAAVKGIKSASNETIEGIAATFNEYMTENPTLVPSNMAREYAQVVEAVFNLEMEYTDDDGEEVTGTYLDYLLQAVPVVVVEKKSKSKESADVVKAMQEQIAALQQGLQAQRLAK